MGIFDMFSNNTAAAQAQKPAATPASPGQLPTDPPAMHNTDSNLAGSVPAATPAPAEPPSPLDAYKNLWDSVPTDPNAPAGNQPLDPAKLREAIGKADFSQSINPESLAAISQGGEAAQAAFISAMNTVAQNVMTQATLASNEITNRRVEEATAAMTASIPELLRKQALNTNLREANPLFSNPAVKPVIDAVQSQLAATNPNATPSELATMAQSFVTVMGEAFSPKPAKPTTPDSQNWDKFVNGQ